MLLTAYQLEIRTPMLILLQIVELERKLGQQQQSDSDVAVLKPTAASSGQQAMSEKAAHGRILRAYNMEAARSTRTATLLPRGRGACRAS
jgi:hypothetical protein